MESCSNSRVNMPSMGLVNGRPGNSESKSLLLQSAPGLHHPVACMEFISTKETYRHHDDGIMLSAYCDQFFSDCNYELSCNLLASGGHDG